jgi:hypothetical protein
MTKLKRFVIEISLAWLEARKAYASRYINQRLGS